VDHGGGDRGLQLLTAGGESTHRRTIDYHDRSLNKLTTIHSEQKTLPHFRKGHCAGRKGPDHGRRPRTPAQGIERIAARENQQGEKKRTERSQPSTDSFHTASYTRLTTEDGNPFQSGRGQRKSGPEWGYFLQPWWFSPLAHVAPLGPWATPIPFLVLALPPVLV